MNSNTLNVPYGMKLFGVPGSMKKKDILCLIQRVPATNYQKKITIIDAKPDYLKDYEYFIAKWSLLYKYPTHEL